MASDVSHGGRFVGGPEDGRLPPDHGRARWFTNDDGHAYMADRDGTWRYVGAECSACRAVNQPDGHGRIPAECRLCGAGLFDLR